MSSSMEDEYILYLEDLEDFVDTMLDEADYPQEQFENLFLFWGKKFKETSALVITDQMVADYMSDFENENLNRALRTLIEEGKVDVMWDSEKNDFVFKAAE